MSPITVSTARKNLYTLVDEVNSSHEPLLISGKRNDAVLLSAEDWNSIQETMYLLSVPKMRESLVKGKAEKLSECSEPLKW
jgi:antitoxin YefM